MQPNADKDVLSKFGLNPDYVRWELHRVWVIEATLRQGQRHQSVRSRYYCDEGTWLCSLADRWDANGELWRTLWTHNVVAQEIPATVCDVYGVNDLLSGTSFVFGLSNEKGVQRPTRPKYPDSRFTPDAIAGESVR